MNFTAQAETPESALAKMVHGFQSETIYKKAAKKMMDKYNLTVDEPTMAQALKTTKVRRLFLKNYFFNTITFQLMSEPLYREEYEKAIKGSSAANPRIAHPEYIHLSKANKLTSKVRSIDAKIFKRF